MKRAAVIRVCTLALALLVLAPAGHAQTLRTLFIGNSYTAVNSLPELVAAVATALGGPTIVPGFLTRAEVKDRYAARSERDLSEIDFYISFAYWKVACIIEGVYSRYRAGAGI